jgi:multiple sugar transport system ATP-binding protein
VAKDGGAKPLAGKEGQFDSQSVVGDGSPAMNLADARLVRDGDGGLAVTFADHKLPVPQSAIAEHPGLERFVGRQVIVGIRPSSFEDGAFAPEGWPRLKAEAQVTELLGSEVDVIFPIRTPAVQHEVMVAQFDTAARDASEDQDQAGGLAGEGESLWTARVNPKSSVRPGRPVDLAVDTSALYWFDPHSGHAIPRQPGDQPSGAQDTTRPQAAA